MILKNKFTKEWEFPTGNIKFGESFLRAKQNIFNTFAQDWKIKYYSNAPLIHTLREFSKAEQEDKMNMGMKGVRTYYFQAHHLRGLPEMNFSNTNYEDFAWIPKRQLNEYFSKDYYEVFINVCTTR